MSGELSAEAKRYLTRLRRLHEGILRDVSQEDRERIACLMAGDVPAEELDPLYGWRFHGEQYAERAFSRIADIVGIGVEAVYGEFVGGYAGDVRYTYLNAGDIYARTIVRDVRRGAWKLTDLGTLLGG